MCIKHRAVVQEKQNTKPEAITNNVSFLNIAYKSTAIETKETSEKSGTEIIQTEDFIKRKQSQTPAPISIQNACSSHTGRVAE